MEKKLLLILFLIAGALLSCDNQTSTKNNANSDSDTLDLAKLKIKSVKSIDRTKIPKYRLMTEQGSAPSGDNKLEVLDMKLPNECTGMPVKIGDLKSGTVFNLYQFDASTSASASAMGFKGSIGKKELLLVQDYVRWSDVTCGDVTKKYGIGLRCFIHVKSIKGDISGGLSGIAASVELNRGSATFNLMSLGFGIDGTIIASGLATSGKYDVESFSKLAIIYNETLKTLNANSTIEIKPVELP